MGTGRRELGGGVSRLVVALALLGPSLWAASPPASGRLFFLDIRGGRVVSVNADGSDAKDLVTGRRTTPDGIAVDVEAGHVYWSNMGRAMADDGSVERINLDGSNPVMVVPPGGTFTAKQLKLDKKNGKLYWSDREGMRIQRSNLDGSRLETLVETGRGDDDRWDARNWCVGIAVDAERGKIYWTQKGGDDAGVGRILRANLEVPKGQTPARRGDIEVLFDGLPEPIDLELDLDKRQIYWTDRGNLPGGNSVARAPMDPPKGANPWTRTDRQILLTGLREGIGIALDLRGGRMYVTDLGGTVYSAALDGSDKNVLLTGQGTLTGIAFAEMQSTPRPTAARPDAAAVKQRLTGNWKLLKTVTFAENGESRPGNFVAGRLMYGDLEMTAHLTRLTGVKAAPATDVDRAAAYQAYVGYYGPYTIDAARGIVVHHVAGASLPHWFGTDQVRYYAFPDADHLTLSVKSGERVTQTLTWERVR
jgi:hypothetical protein